MFKNTNLKRVSSTLIFGALMSVGTYFFIPTPSASYACAEKREVRSAIRQCMDGAIIRDGKIYTDC